MKRTFVEVKDFKKQVEILGGDTLLQTIQNEILKDPEVGDLVKETGGIRKLRIATKGKGKSGGIRVFYLDVPEKEKCYLLYILEKSEADNISAEGKKMFKKLAQILKLKN
jgi:hypothetical protein